MSVFLPASVQSFPEVPLCRLLYYKVFALEGVCPVLSWLVRRCFYDPNTSFEATDRREEKRREDPEEEDPAIIQPSSSHHPSVQWAGLGWAGEPTCSDPIRTEPDRTGPDRTGEGRREHDRAPPAGRAERLIRRSIYHRDWEIVIGRTGEPHWRSARFGPVRRAGQGR